MSLIATAVKHMMAAGMSCEAIVEAVAEMEASASRTGPSQAAVRQKRYRERHGERLKGLRLPDREWLPIVGAIVARDGNCTYCGAEDNLTADHVVPVSQGGGHEPSNLVAACMTCNSSKGGLTPEEWVERGGRKDGVEVTLRHVTSRYASPSPLSPPLKVSPDPFKITPPISPQPSSSDEDVPPAEKPNGAGLKPEHVLEVWNETADRLGLPKARLTEERRRKLRTMIRKYPIEDFTEAIAAIERSTFCRGENNRGWRANFDFLLQPTSFNKLIEGTYDGTG